ncbi:flippase-like domain-containing protein [bacterium]|nr:flippase-like domain-containing protein [bacterium]
MKKYLPIVTKLFVTLALIMWLVSRVDLSLVKDNIFKISLANILFLVILSFLGQSINALRWRYLACNLSHRSSAFTYIRMGFIGAFFNHFMPTSIGGDFGRAGLLAKKEGIAYSEALSVTFMQRLTGFSILILSAFIGGVYFYYETHEISVMIWSSGCFVGIVFLSLLIFTPIMDKLFQLLPSFINEFIFHVRRYRKWGKVVLGSFVISIFFYFIEYLTHWLILRFMGFEIPIYYTIALVPMIYLVALLPISINGLGLKENAYVFFFGLIAIGSEASLSMAVIMLFLVLLQGLVGGIFLLFHNVGSKIEIPTSQTL